VSDAEIQSWIARDKAASIGASLQVGLKSGELTPDAVKRVIRLARRTLKKSDVLALTFELAKAGYPEYSR